MARPKSTSDARQRILDTAERLFYGGGIRGVGIDRIIAESGVAKMTLYAHFRSKDELIVEVLRQREVRFLEWFADAMARHEGEAGGRIGAVFGALREWFEQPDFRGCAFINASVELADPDHPGFSFAGQQKGRFFDFIAELIEEASPGSSAKLAPAISLLIEGAIVTSVLQGSSRPAEIAREATFRLLSQVSDS